MATTIEEPGTRERLYDFIVRYKLEHDGVAPTYREMMEQAGVAKSYGHINYLLGALEEAGRISLGDGARQIYVTGGCWMPPESV